MRAILTQALTEPGIISKCYSTFHGYSILNQMHAMQQCQQRDIAPGPIATFKKWQELGRQVRKGDKAIALTMPVTVNKKDDTGNKTGECFQWFALKNNWFVLSQTDGADYANDATTPAWDKTKALTALEVCETAYDRIDGNCQGYASGKTIAINPVALYPHKTRFHELAHVMLGHTAERMTDSERTPKDIREVEAESTAYILCALLGLPGLDESRGYIQSWLNQQQLSDKSIMRIFGAANNIMTAGQ